MIVDAKNMIAGAKSRRPPTVAAGLAGQLFRYIIARGIAPEALVEAAGVDPAQFEDLDLRIPFARYAALVSAGKMLTGDAALAARFAAAIDMSEFSVVGLLAHASETMREALVQLNRYGRLVVEVDLGAEERFVPTLKDGAAWLVDTRAEPNAYPDLTESTFARMICGPRRFLPSPHVLEAHMTHPRPPHADELEAIYQVPIRFAAAWNALRMAPGVNEERVALQPRYVFGILSEHADALMRKLAEDATLRGRVERILVPVLHTGEVSMDGVADALGMSRQTLFRRLKEEGVTFERVLDDLRRRLALDYLSGKRVSVNEAAYLVGFSDPAAFSRAFKRWTGKSPRQARGSVW
jgi:AraC-like DNA-binding protein